jgi:hypothetical protein
VLHISRCHQLKTEIKNKNRMKDKNQDRHEKLIDFLSKFTQYQDENGKSTLTKVKESRTSGKVEKISTNDINKGVIVFTDLLNIHSGSVGNFNLYRLLKAYVSVPEFRDKMNEVADEAMKYEYKNKK